VGLLFFSAANRYKGEKLVGVTILRRQKEGKQHGKIDPFLGTHHLRVSENNTTN
jgi:hypothetical protein